MRAQDMETSNYESKIREKIQQFRLIDDVFMSKVFESKECTEYMLRIIMENPNPKVLEISGDRRIFRR